MRQWPTSGRQWPVQQLRLLTRAARSPPADRTAKDGARTRDNLPLPPIMDSEVVAAREKYRTAKPPQDLAKLTEFQKKLYANLHAHALASPVRACGYSTARLPEHFLLNFRVKKHEDTDQPWLLPTTLLTKNHKIQKAGPASYLLLREPLVRSISSNRDKPTRFLEVNTRRQLGSSKVIWREDMPSLILSLLRAQVIRRLRWLLTHPDTSRIHVFPTSYRIPPHLTASDEASSILQLVPTLSPAVRDLSMRVEASADDIASELVPQFAKINSWLKARMPGPSAKLMVPWLIPAVPEVVRSARLDFPTFEVEGAESEAKEGELDGDGDGARRATAAAPSRISLFPLYELLGRDGVTELLEETPARGVTWIVLKRNPWNIGLELMLSKLQGYLVDIKLQ